MTESSVSRSLKRYRQLTSCGSRKVSAANLMSTVRSLNSADGSLEINCSLPPSSAEVNCTGTAREPGGGACGSKRASPRLVPSSTLPSDSPQKPPALASSQSNPSACVYELTRPSRVIMETPRSAPAHTRCSASMPNRKTSSPRSPWPAPKCSTCAVPLTKRR